ncbi:MAG: carbon monoxide dehydrogenase [Bradyrhizobium sp.]|nr:carbon monoxide dehydrogenase [Bradyrhizobium sp.]
MYEFNYHAPQSLEAAIAALAGAHDGKLLAGGMTLIPTLKQRLAQPSDLVDLAKIDRLNFIRREDRSVVIGAMTTHVAVATSTIVRESIPGLARLAGGIGDAQVRYRGTIGGSISNNDPAADYPASLLALGATIQTDRREIPAEEFFVSLFETALETNEIVVHVRFPVVERSAYVKFRNPASRYAVVGIFVAKSDRGVRVTATGAGPVVFRLSEFEEALTGSFRPEAVAGLEIAAEELSTDIHASAEYRAHLIPLMVRRAIAEIG